MSNKEKRSIVEMVLEGMNPNVKAVMFTLLALPLFVALSGMILNVNVGSWIDRAMETHLEVTKGQLAELEKHTELLRGLSGLEPRIITLEKSVHELEGFACTHDKGNPEFCD